MIQEQAHQSNYQEKKKQNEFFIEANMPQIEVISASQSARRQEYEDSQQENDNEEAFDIKTVQLIQGNPILPPGKHYTKQQPSFRLKFLSNRQKFNKTTFMSTLGNSLTLTSRKMELEANKRYQHKNKIMEQDEQEDIEYANLIRNKQQVYRRIKNGKLNRIGKDKILCSIFFDSRKQKIMSKAVPIYQHIAKLKNLKAAETERDWLQFSSSFQSGNLLMALKIPSDHLVTYELYMQNDVNTKGCAQWFYFKIINYSRGKAKFKIMNFYKQASLYQKGMKIAYSHDGVQWKRTGTAITYSKNEQHQGYYTLQFIYEFDANSKATYFSYGYPYTYSVHLSNFLNTYNSDPKYQKMVAKGTLCLSAMNNPIPILYITNQNNKKQQKQIIYIIGRQHPGETPSSYIMEGVILFLTSNTQEAKELRDKYQFRIVPMVNVDGVISGNYRSNISGFDINRQWQFPSKKVLPEVYWLKQQVASNKKNVAFFLDIHAHSRKMNSFFYSSNRPNKENKLYPFVCSKLNKFVSYNESTFNDDPSKKTTARVIVQSQLSIQKSLTFQVSFYGYYDEVKQTNYSFKQSDLRNIGECLGVAFYYSMIGIQNVKKNEGLKILPKHLNQKQKTLLKNSAKILQKWNKELQKQAKYDKEDAFSQGSSIDPEHFQLKQEQKIMLTELLERQLRQQQQNKGEDPYNKQSKRKQFIYSSIESQESKLLNPKGDFNHVQPLGMSGTQFYQISSAKTKAQTKNLFSVKQLQLELQSNRQVFPERKIRGLRLKMGPKNVGLIDNSNRNTRYGSLELDIDNRKNYRNEVIEMKKALKYLLQSKSSNYEDYKSCFKSFNTQISYMTKNQFKSNKK